MNTFLITLLICSVTMSLLSILYMAITPLLEKRYSNKWLYYSWLIILLGLIIPFRPHFDTPFVRVEVPAGASPTVQIGSMTLTTAPIEAVDLPAAAKLPSVPWETVSGFIWLTGMTTFLAYNAIKHTLFMRTVRRWSEDITDEQSLTLWQNLKSEVGIKRQIRLQSCEFVGSPLLVGLLHPRALLPRAYISSDELSFILKHELVHFKRKDLWYKALVVIATAIHWFNPVVYLMAKVINLQCEASCDDEVIKNADANTRQRYSETIIGVIRRAKLATVLSTNFYGGKKGIKKRILSIMDTSQKRVGSIILCIVLIATLGTGIAFAINRVESSIVNIWKNTTAENDSITLEFKNDNTFQSVVEYKNGEQSNEEGTYAVMGNKITLTTTPSPDDPPEGRYEVIYTYQIIGNKLTLTDGDGNAFELTRE